MSATIPIREIEAAVRSALHGHKIGHGPLVIGFVPPEKIDPALAQRLAEQISEKLGATGGKAADVAFEPGHVSHGGNIIIGLIARDLGK